MPSWPIHIGIANKLNETLKLGDDFILGNIMPDVLDGYLIKTSNVTNKNQSHFRTLERIKIANFLNDYKGKLDNPIILGYLVHLVTDKYYNNYTLRNHFYDENHVILNDNTLANKDLTTLKMKQREYIKYGNYLAANKKLGKNISINDKTLDNLKDLPFNYEKKEIDDTLNLINKWINNEMAIENHEYKLYTFNELDRVYHGCINYLLFYLEKLQKENK